MTWSPVSPGESRGISSTERGKGGNQRQGAKGRKFIPPGVKAGIQAMMLTGEHKATEVARAFAVSPDLVRRLAHESQNIDRDHVAAITRGLPAMLKVATAGFAAKTVELLEQGRYGDATKTMFGAKLGTEATRWAQPAADNPGATLLSFIEALGKAGGGSLTVAPPVEPGPIEVIAEIIPEAEEPETLMPE